jgi:hypothetical protein
LNPDRPLEILPPLSSLMRRYAFAMTLPSAALLLLGCDGQASAHDPDVPILVDAEPQVLISMESALLGAAVDLAMGSDGSLYVLDGQARVVHRVAPDGVHAGTIGREGQGPGELLRPTSLRFLGDTLAVVDPGNGRVQRFDPAGNDAGVTLLPAPGPAPTLGPDGTLVRPTMGFDSVLAVIHAPDGSERARIGEVGAPVEPVVVMSQMRETALAGGIPGIAFNSALPAIGALGEIWLVVAATARIEGYGADGEFRFYRELEHPGFDEAREEAIRRTAEADGPGFTIPRLIRRIRPQVDGLWVLIDPGPGAPAEILVLDREGHTERILRFERVHDAGDFVVDADRGHIHFVLPDQAEVVRVQVEPQVLLRSR